MKKNLHYLIFILLFNACDMYAMNQIVSIFNFCRDKCPIFKSPNVLQNNNPFDRLPCDLQGKIIKTYFNLVIHEDDESYKYIDCEKLENYLLKVPINFGMRFVQELNEVQKACQNEICGKKILLHDLLLLPKKERDVFIRITNRSWVTQKIEGNITPNDYLIIKASKNENIKQGLQLKILSVSKNVRNIQCSAATFATIANLAWLFSPLFDKTIGGIIFPVGVIGGIVGFGVYEFSVLWTGPAFKEK